MVGKKDKKTQQTATNTTAGTNTSNRHESVESGPDLPYGPPAYSDVPIYDRVYENVKPLPSRKPLPPVPEDSKDDLKYANPAFSTAGSSDDGSSIYGKGAVSLQPTFATKGEKQVPVDNPTYDSNKTVLNKPPSNRSPVYDIPGNNTPVKGGKETLLGGGKQAVEPGVFSSVLSSADNPIYSKPMKGKNSIVVPGGEKAGIKSNSNNTKDKKKEGYNDKAVVKNPQITNIKISMDDNDSIMTEGSTYKTPVYSKNNKGRIRKVSTRSDEVPLFGDRRGSVSSLTAAFDNFNQAENSNTVSENHYESLKKPNGLPVNEPAKYNVQNKKNEYLSNSKK